MITAQSYTKVVSAMTAKIGVSLSPLMATFYERVLSHDFETEDFLRGARILYAEPLTRWPAPHDFSAIIATAAGRHRASLPVDVQAIYDLVVPPHA